MIDDQAATNTSQRTKMAKLHNSAGFSRLLVIWGITLIAGLICLGVTLLLIERSKQVIIPVAPPLIPTAANPVDTPPEPQEVNLFLLDTTALTLVPIKTERRLHRELRPRLSQVVRALIQETPPNFRNTIPVEQNSTKSISTANRPRTWTSQTISPMDILAAQQQNF